MTIFRNIADKNLYLIHRVSPRGILGHWHEATPLFPNQGTAHLNGWGKVKHVNPDDFVAVSHR